MMPRPTLLLLLAVALAAGCAPAAGPLPLVVPAGSAVPVDPYRRCESAPEAEDCVAAVEAELMARSAGRVARRGDTLRVRTDDGRTIPLVNDRTGGDRSVGYRYQGRVEPLAASLLSVHFYEGGAYVLVSDATGDQTHLIGPPLPAPDGSRFAALGLDLEAGYDPNGVQLWRVTEHGPRLEWGLMGGESWGASDGVWRSPTVLEFTRHAVVPPNPEPVPTRMRLVIDGPGLRVEPVAEPASRAEAAVLPLSCEAGEGAGGRGRGARRRPSPPDVGSQSPHLLCSRDAP